MKLTFCRRRPNPFLRFSAWVCIASLLSGMTEAYAALPEEPEVKEDAVLSQTSGWVCSVDLVETRVEPEKVYMGWITYGNLGAAPIDAPYVHLDAGDGTGIKFAADDPWSAKLEFLATSMDAPASRLEPGEVRRLPFFYRTAGAAATIRFGYVLDDPSEFNWPAAASLMRPSWVADPAWTVAMARLRAKMGTTWNEILSQLRADADHLARVGDPVRRVDRIWRLETEEALGMDLAVPTLAETTDLARAARAFPLGFTRTYGTSLPSRAREGILGPGWSDNFDVRASVEEGGNVLSIWAGSAVEYRFHRTDAGWVPENGADPTVVKETEKEILLSVEKGPELAIAKPSYRLARMTDGKGHRIDFARDGEGRLLRAQHSDGPFLEFAYRADGHLESVADDLGRVCRYEYADGRLSVVRGPAGLATRYRYWPADGSAAAGALRQIVSPDGSTLDFAWDGAGRLATFAANGDSLVTEIRRGPLGCYGIVTPNGGETRYTFGSLGQPLAVVDALGHKSTIHYQGGDLLASVTGATGKRASFRYDRLGRLSRLRTPGGNVVKVGYDEDGRIGSLTDPRGNAYEFGYDELGRDLSVSFAGGPALRVEYDGNGDMARIVNRRGQAIDLETDAKGRPVSATWEDGRTFRIEYDGRDNPVRAEDSETGAVAIEYDAQDRPVRVVYPGSRGFAYRYDATGRVAERAALDGSSVQRYEYDAVGRMVRMTDGDGGLLLENGFDPKTGELLRQRYGNGTESVYRHDLLGRETRIEHRGPGGETIAAFDYTYDDDGHVATQNTAEGTERYEYDADGQLVAVEYPDGNRETFEYDAAGNRTARTRTGEGRTEYEINEFNQVVSATAPDGGVTRYEYDADGNLVRKAAPNAPAMVYGYDIRNRLVSVREEVAGGLDWSCAYDVFGNRVRVTENGQTTERLYSPDGLPSVAAEYRDGGLARRHVLANGLVLADVDADGTQRWLHADAVAAVRAVTDADGRPVAHADYRAFGEVRSADAASGTGTWGWSGMLGIERDPLGLLFMRNRSYDPELGRFVQQDPLGLAAGQFNLYLYCGNNPVNGVDPLGLFDWSWENIKEGVSNVADGITENVKDWWSGVTNCLDGFSWCKALGLIHAAAGVGGWVCAVAGVVAAVIAAVGTAPAWATGVAIAGLVACAVKVVSSLLAKETGGASIQWKEIGWEAVELALSGLLFAMSYAGGKVQTFLEKLFNDKGNITKETYAATREWLSGEKWKGAEKLRKTLLGILEQYTGPTNPKLTWGPEWIAFRKTLEATAETWKSWATAGTIADKISLLLDSLGVAGMGVEDLVNLADKGMDKVEEMVDMGKTLVDAFLSMSEAMDLDNSERDQALQEMGMDPASLMLYLGY